MSGAVSSSSSASEQPAGDSSRADAAGPESADRADARSRRGSRPRRGPTRRALNPILSDAVLFEGGLSSTDVFYTPLAQAISRHLELIIAAGAGAFLLTAWIGSLLGMPVPLVHLCTLFAFAIGAIPAIEEVWEKLTEFRIDIDLLMLLGAGLAAMIGRPFEGALLLFLFAISGAMERYALQRTKSAIAELRKIAPREATVIDGEQLERVAIRNVRIGARILVRPGERVPLDGKVLSGTSSIDESAINGESIPRDVEPGSEVFAGTHNADGRLEVEVTRAATDTTLAKVIELVTKARENPSRAQGLVDRIGPAYSVSVIVLSFAVGAISGLALGVPWEEAIRRGIAVLITASPCALIIATPVAYLSAIAAAARRGVLIKGGAHLEAFSQTPAVVFDKTGTLTTGRIRLSDIEPPDGMTERDVLALLGPLERSSQHPLALAVTRAFVEAGLASREISNFRATAGVGLEGTVGDERVWAGRFDALGEHSSADLNGLAKRLEELRAAGRTVSAFSISGNPGLIAFEDTLREEAPAVVDALRAQGVRRIEMLTGDHATVAERVASSLRLDGFRAELAPQDKVTQAKLIKEEFGGVALVGDGINDAPALAHADVGIAVGSIGADVALEAADIVLMGDRIDEIAWLHRHARRTATIVRQNLGIAIGVIAVLSLFAAAGKVPLPLAVVGHEGSTVIVALNALRLLGRGSDRVPGKRASP